MRERDRYRRAGWRDQVDDVLHWFPGHPRATIAIALVLALVGVLRLLTPELVGFRDVAAGQCLFVGDAAVAAGPPDPPGREAIRNSLAAGAAERTACTSNHSVEVTGLAWIANPASSAPLPSREIAGSVDPALDAAAAAACAPVTEAYLGSAAGHPSLTRLAVVPPATGRGATSTLAVCLVVSSSPGWLTQPARNLAP